MKFVFTHPDSGEKKTVYMVEDEIRAILCDIYEDGLRDMISCDCQPVGETNVIECNCYEHFDEFELQQ